MGLRAVEVWHFGSGPSDHSPPGAGQQRSAVLALGGAPAERQHCGSLCCMPEPPVHVCISTVRSCSTSTGQGDSIGLPGERIFPLSISSKCAFIHREPVTEMGRRLGLVRMCGYGRPLRNFFRNIILAIEYGSCFHDKSPRLSEF